MRLNITQSNEREAEVDQCSRMFGGSRGMLVSACDDMRLHEKEITLDGARIHLTEGLGIKWDIFYAAIHINN